MKIKVQFHGRLASGKNKGIVEIDKKSKNKNLFQIVLRVRIVINLQKKSLHGSQDSALDFASEELTCVIAINIATIS